LAKVRNERAIAAIDSVSATILYYLTHHPLFERVWFYTSSLLVLFGSSPLISGLDPKEVRRRPKEFLN